MKVRTDFVTNSSSSSFILGFSNKDNMMTELEQSLKGYPIEYSSIVIRDVSNSTCWTKSEVIESMPQNGDWDKNETPLKQLLHDIWYDAEWMVQREMEKRGMSYKDVLSWIKTEDAKILIREKVKEFTTKFDEFGDDAVFVEVEYEDHSEPGAELEHYIMPRLDCTVDIISHH